LKQTKIDEKSKGLIQDLEEALLTKLEKNGNPFVKGLVDQDTITVNDLTNGVLQSCEDNSVGVKEVLDDYLQKIRLRAKEHALKMIGKPKIAGIVRTAASSFEDSVNQAFEAIDGIPAEIVEKIKAEWLESGGENNMIPQLIKKELSEFKDEGFSKKELREALYELWEKQKTVYKRIVRTTTINAYAKSQLEEWDAQGIAEVERHCIDDHRTCQICRMLCAPGRNRYTIKELLGFDDPITYASHPQCRDFYTPVVDWQSLDEYFTEPLVDVDVDDAEISNLPTSLQEQVEELSKRVDLEGVIEFVPDIVDTVEWQEDRFNEHRDAGYGQREALQMVEMEKEDLRGTLITYENPEKMLISGQAVDASSFAYSMVVSQASQAWRDADKGEWRTMYEEHLAHDLPFITFDAEQNAEAYFVECFIAFVTNPYRLLTIDEEAYTTMTEVTGKDFFELGAVR